MRMISLVLSFGQEQFFVFKELNVQPVRIPTRAGDPPHMLLWSADEIMPIIGGLGIGIVLDQVLICVVIGSSLWLILALMALLPIFEWMS